jgi:hypothetical protein
MTKTFAERVYTKIVSSMGARWVVKGNESADPDAVVLDVVTHFRDKSPAGFSDVWTYTYAEAQCYIKVKLHTGWFRVIYVGPGPSPARPDTQPCLCAKVAHDLPAGAVLAMHIEL